jgi:hypothetical protein
VSPNNRNDALTILNVLVIACALCAQGCLYVGGHHHCGRLPGEHFQPSWIIIITIIFVVISELYYAYRICTTPLRNVVVRDLIGDMIW